MIRRRKLSMGEMIKMIMKQRIITTYEDIQYDETIGYGRNAAGAYFRGEAFEPVADPKEIARAYFENGIHVPPEFAEVRNILAGLIA